MKHYFFKSGLFVAVAAMALMAGCKKDAVDHVTLGVRAEGEGGSASKVIINPVYDSIDEAHSHELVGYMPAWEADGSEQVKVNTNSCSVLMANRAYVERVPSCSTYRAVYPASIVTTADLSDAAIADGKVSVNLPSVQEYKVDAGGNQQVEMPMGAYLTEADAWVRYPEQAREDAELRFRNLCSLVKMTVENDQAVDLVIKSLTLESSAAGLCGAGTVTLTPATLNESGTSAVIKLSNNDSRKLTLAMGRNEVVLSPSQSRSFYFVVPAFTTASQMTMGVFAVTTDGTQLYSFSRTGGSPVTLGRNQVAPVTVKIANVTPEAVGNLTTAGGRFKVDAAGRYVSFGSGNLIYSSTTGIFSFDSSQYAYSSSRNGANGEWEYFGWSTAATYFGMNTSTSTATYSGDFVDWGTRVGNGTTWRTLTREEWGYIFNTRPGGFDVTYRKYDDSADSTIHARYAQVRVCGKAGIILFPEQDTVGNPFAWPLAETDKPTVYNKQTDSWNNIDYTYAQWQALEAAGCVFLPAAGHRSGTSVTNAGTSGHYWSASLSSAAGACYLLFYGTGVYPQYSNSRYYGFSVRLVQDIN